MQIRRWAITSIAAVLSLGACAGDPAEVAARGAEELARHEASPWARLDHPALSEISYEAEAAHVKLAHPGSLAVDIERPTTFVQQFDSAVPLDRGLFEDLAAGLADRGAEVRGVTCGPVEQLSIWRFAVKSDGDWLQIRLAEQVDRVEYRVMVRDSAGPDLPDSDCT